MNSIIDSLHQQIISQELVQSFIHNQIKNLNAISFPLVPSAHLLSEVYSNLDSNMIIIVPNWKIADNLHTYLKKDLSLHSYIFSPLSIFFYEFNAIDKREAFFRIEAANKLQSLEKNIIITTPYALLMPTINPEDLAYHKYVLMKGMRLEPEAFIKKLVSAGFKRVDSVYEYGEFSQKGEIIDIWNHPLHQPTRIILFDEIIEEIRLFEADTGRKIESIEQSVVLPVRQFYPVEENTMAFLSLLYQDNNPDEFFELFVKKIKEADECPVIWALSHLCKKKYYLFDFVRNDDIIAIYNYESVLKEFDEEYDTSIRAYKELEIKGLTAPDNLFLLREDFLRSYSHHRQINFMKESGKENNLSLKMEEVGQYKNKFEEFRIINKELQKQGYSISILSNNAEDLKRLSILFKDIPINYINHFIPEGFILHSTKTAVYSAYDLLDYKIKLHEEASFKTEFIQSQIDIETGDFIVHMNYGIGIYEGTKKLTVMQQEKDYIQLRYKDKELLFVPVENIGLIQKYISFSREKPVLDSITKSYWKKTVARTKEDVMKFARDLLDLYEERKKIQGISFDKDNEDTLKFDANFPYTETYDQLTAIDDVKKDMENPYPMDRLICGDVGFGKTEVAIRAAYKAVMSGFQVAVIAPTTILAEQHYEIFSSRFTDIPVRIAHLSRLVNKSSMQNDIKGIKDGTVDIIIGTHRVLSSDIQFKNIGLLIIDEEHKFGVEHKEKIKRMKTNIDILSLSATPIPRTLYMTLSLLRPLSIINTAPENRIPIEVFVEAFADDVIKYAIEKELSRNGKVYFVHNRVQTIWNMVQYLKALLHEDVTIIYAHGQMGEHELEKNIYTFKHTPRCILVATTIIESGIDIPDVNTIIIDGADKFGLANLYQLKGRVGRRSSKAYAYLLYPNNSVVSEIAMKRLQIISDYSELGSGYKIALKDLEIRGAGNILGKKQSGFITNVGYFLYEKLLGEAIKILQNKEDKKSKSDVELLVAINIPDGLYLDNKQKLHFYETLYDIDTLDDLNRFAEHYSTFLENDDGFKNLIAISRLRIKAKNKNIIGIKETPSIISIIFDSANIDTKSFLSYVKEEKVKFDPHRQNQIELINSFKSERDKLAFVECFIDEIFMDLEQKN